MKEKSLSHKLEQVVFYLLGFILVSYIFIEIIELFYQFGKAIISVNENNERLLVSKEQTRIVLPVFFNILIAVELMDTLKSYISEHSIKVQSILLIGLIAIGRKILVLDVGHADGMTNLGMASLIIALSAGYYLVKKAK
ncbi:MAG: phosphate-starvation-inducible PsiE family protein [Cyclobacteriaceae bacterium]|nr:phosphate-starvation-inducible PsiE family protein [Cyclobacteriaceae bacterium]